MRANRDEPAGLELAKKFVIEAFPTTVVLNPDGSEADRILGYKPTSDVYHDKILQIQAGIGTPKALADFYAKDPKNVPALFRLARKYDEIGSREKALEKYKEVITLDPDGNEGMTDFMGAQVTCTEYAEFSIGLFALKAGQVTPQPMLAFSRRHPNSMLLEAAYENLSYLYYEDEASKQEAEMFFLEYQKRFPGSPYPYHAWAGRILYNREKDGVEKGIELEKNALALNARVADAYMDWTLAKLYDLKQDRQSAGEIYGRQYIEDHIGSFQYSLIQYAEFWARDKANSDHAVEIAELAYRTNPGNPSFTNRVAGVYVRVGKLDKALSLYGPEFIKKYQGDRNTLMYYAMFWNQLDRNLDSALEAALRGEQLRPGYVFSDVLGQIYSKQKKYSEAIKAYEKGVTLAPSEEWKETFRKRIDEAKQAAQKKLLSSNTLFQTSRAWRSEVLLRAICGLIGQNLRL